MVNMHILITGATDFDKPKAGRGFILLLEATAEIVLCTYERSECPPKQE